MTGGSSVVVLGHEMRAGAAHKLAAQLDNAEVHTSTRPPSLRASNQAHAYAWRKAADNADRDGNTWCGVIEDDAILHPRIRQLLPEVLGKAPAPIVSCYLGTGRPTNWQARIAKAIDRLDSFGGSGWLIGDELLSHVAVFAEPDVIRRAADTIGGSTITGCDLTLGNWARKHNVPIAYALPSIVDHVDDVPVIPSEGRWREGSEVLARKAWRFGGSAPADVVLWLSESAKGRFGGKFFGGSMLSGKNFSEVLV